MGNLQAKAFVLGIPKIDKQHQMFIDLTKTLNEFIANSSEGYQPNQLLSLILRFRNYAFYHFHTEENMMSEKKFPGFFEQKEAHNRFLIGVIAFEEKFEAAYKLMTQPEPVEAEAESESESPPAAKEAETESESESPPAAEETETESDIENQPDTSKAATDLLDLPGEMNEFVTDWYKKHILEMDTQYVEYLK